MRAAKALPGSLVFVRCQNTRRAAVALVRSVYDDRRALVQLVTDYHDWDNSLEPADYKAGTSIIFPLYRLEDVEHE